MSGIVKAITSVVKAIVNVVVSVVKAVVDFVGDVIGFVLNPFGIFDAPTTPDPGQEAQGVVVTKQGTNIPVPVVYGFRRVGGSTIFAESNGSSNKYLYVVYALCEGEIQGVNRILVNDVDLPLPSGSTFAHGTKINVTSGRFKNRLQFQCFNGKETQVQSSLANETPTWPTKTRKLPGVAYVVMRFEWKEIKTQEDADNNPYSGGIPQVKFDVFGKKVYDVRTHSGGADLSGSYSARTKKYSFNPSSCLLDYLENPRYGAGLSATEIDADSFKRAADKFEQTVNYSSTQTGRALTLNAVLNTGAKVIDNVKFMTAGSRGIMPFVQGRYKLKVEDGGDPTDITSTTVQIAYDVDSNEIIGGLNLDGERKSSKYNQVIVNYIDPDTKFSNQQVVYNQSGDQTVDNDEELTGEFTFHTVTNKAIAYDLAALIYKKSRKQTQISFTATQELMDVEVGDVIRVTDTVLDLSLDTFRVVGIKLKNNGLLDIECVEHDATIYPFTTGPQIDLPPAVYLPDEFIIDPYVAPLPDAPITLFPPLDPDVDEEELTNPPAPSFDVPTPKVSSFEDFSKAGPNGRYYKDNIGQGSDPGMIQQKREDFNFATNGSVGLHYQPFRGDFIFGLARDLGSYLLTVNAPLDTAVDELVIRRYLNGSLENTQTVNIRKQFDRIDVHSGLSTKKINFYWSPGDGGSVYKVVWRKSGNEIEIPDNSDFTTLTAQGQVASVFAGHTYKDLNGSTVTRGNIEGFFNYLLDYHYNNATTNLRVSKSVDLGA